MGSGKIDDKKDTIRKKKKYKFRKKTIIAGLGSCFFCLDPGMDIKKATIWTIKMVNVRQVTAKNLKLFKLSFFI
jgi:hypothetical protein